MRAYTIAADASTIHPTLTAAPKPPREVGIAVILTFAGAFAGLAAEPPGNLAKLVAARETATAGARENYAYTQSVRLEEIDSRGLKSGEYSEVREVIFSPGGERSERFVKEPESRLKNLLMTPEDFADIRTIQPFVLTTDQLWNYDADFKGEETTEEMDCFVLRLRPKRLLSGQRLFDGMIWVRQDDYSVVRSEGQAVPQVITAKQENLFPRFRTVRRKVNGYWFPAITSADDTLQFRSGPIREKLTIRYNDYKKFGSETTLRFDAPE